MAKCNTSEMDLGDLRVSTETPLWGDVTFHQLGLFISGSFGLAAVCVASFLLIGHATHYSKPSEQRHIIRILAMLPIYSIISFVSYWDYSHAIYWETLRDCYEAFAIASFFTLLCNYIEPNLHDQKAYFRKLTPRDWVLPISWFAKCTGGPKKGPFRTPSSGLTFFNIIWIGVFQYCFIRVFFTFVAMSTQFFGRYCQSSVSPAFAHVWVLSFEGTAVTIAMYCLIMFYLQIKPDIAEHKPFLKIACIKLVIFFSFWQNLLISFLSSSHGGHSGVIRPTSKVAFPDIQVGIPSMLLCIEMFLFSLLHIVAFPWRKYDIRQNSDPAAHYRGGPGGWRAVMDAFNPWDIVKASARGFRWLFVGRRHRADDNISTEETKQENIEMGRSERNSRFGPSGGPTIPLPGGFGSTQDERDGRPAFKRQDSDNNDDQAGLLSNAQDVSTVNLRSASPFRDTSPDSKFEKEVSPYGDESGYHAVSYPRESIYEGRQYSSITTRFPETSYDSGVYTPPSPIDTPPGVRPVVRLPDDEADLGYHGTGQIQQGKRR